MPRLLACLLLSLGLSAAADAQRRPSASPPRVGVSFEGGGAVSPRGLLPDGVAVGVRGRVALPVNADLSVAADLGALAYLAGGSSDAEYVLNPQTSLIVTLPGRERVRYAFGGFGGFVPLSGGGGGPTLHIGAGTALLLRDTSLFLEVNPSLLIGETATVGVLAARAGVIF